MCDIWPLEATRAPPFWPIVGLAFVHVLCVCAKVVFVPGVLSGVQVVNCEISCLQYPH